jgi:murein DD-endopeptidase MepM/ murein hydrolase activator NlpD
MIKSILITAILFFGFTNRPNFYLPINSFNRQSTKTLLLTSIGEFGLLRKERPGIPAHYHTGIDIKRPANNYIDEPIFSIYNGIVISVRNDGPYAQLIIEHDGDQKFWTVYEHVAGIKVGINEHVTPDLPIARFMNKNELDKYGWQFDHLHLEILKIKPVIIKQDRSNPERRYSSYSLNCLTKEELNKYFYNPVEFFKRKFVE